MKSILLILIALTIFACKKEEGLSDHTGNLEVNTKNYFGPLYFEIYSEEQYYLFLNHQQAISLKSGSASDLIFTVRELEKGYIGLRLSGNGQSWDTLVYIHSNKINRITFP